MPLLQRGRVSTTQEARKKGIPPVRGYLAGAFYGECEGRGWPVRLAAKPTESAPLQEGNGEHRQNGKKRPEAVAGRARPNEHRE